MNDGVQLREGRTIPTSIFFSFFHTLFDALRPRDSKLGWDIYGRNMGENIKRHNAGKTLGGFTLTKALTNVF